MTDEAAPAASPVRVAYLVNQYPAVSHSFIRREVLALEDRGVEVMRMALRGWQAPLADPKDVQERDRTRFVLRQRPAALLGSLWREATARPGTLFGVLRLATRMARGSERSLLYHWMYAVEACVAAEWLRRAGIRHVHAHFGTNSTEVAMLAAQLCDASYSFTVHGPDEFDQPRAVGLAEKIRRAAFVVAISSFTRSQLMRWVDRAHWDKIHVVHCGLDAAFHDGALAAPANVARLVCVGRLSEQKGQFLLLDALKKVVDAGHAVELVLAGDGDLRAMLERRIDDLGLGAHVRITGWISSVEVRSELMAARALVLPSFAEGLPVVIMEAMALRRPVITTYIAGIPELVRNGESGWLIPAGDVAALADAIVDCLRASPEALRRMGDAARQRVLERHDIDVEAGKLARLFEACMVGRPSAQAASG